MRNRNACSSLIAVLIAIAASAVADAQCEVNELLPREHEQYDRVGEMVAIFGDTILMEGHHDDDECPHYWHCDSGSAYVFRFDPDLGLWIEVQELHASDPAKWEAFGAGLDFDGETMVIGAPGEGNDGQDVNSGIGAAHIFRFDSGSGQWIEQQKLTAADGEPGDELSGKAISGDVVMLNSLGDDDNGENSGAVYAFRFDPDQSMWVQEQKLLAGDGAPVDCFGWDVDVEGDVAVVGAKLDDDHGTDCGSAYIFRYHPENSPGTRWVQEQKLVPDEIGEGDGFGWRVAISGEVIVVGAKFDDGAAVGAGAAYVFRYDGTEWIQEQRLFADDAEEGDRFGHSVDIDGDIIIVSAPNEDDLGEQAGCGYIFRYDGSAWVQDAQKFYASDGAAGDLFGVSLALHDHRAVFGAFMHDCEGDQAGAAYAYDLAGCAADVDCDGDTDQADLGIVLADWGCVASEPGHCSGDLDGDFDTDHADLGILLADWGCTAAP